MYAHFVTGYIHDSFVADLERPIKVTQYILGVLFVFSQQNFTSCHFKQQCGCVIDAVFVNLNQNLKFYWYMIKENCKSIRDSLPIQ